MPLIDFEGKMPVLGKRVFIASGADVLGDVRIGDDASIWYRCVLRGDIHSIDIGARANLQDGVIVHVEHGLFPVVVEEECSVGHGAILHGCVLRRGCLVGMGATVLNGAEIGEGALVAAGALVRELIQLLMDRVRASDAEIQREADRLLLRGSDRVTHRAALAKQSWLRKALERLLGTSTASEEQNPVPSESGSPPDPSALSKDEVPR